VLVRIERHSACGDCNKSCGLAGNKSRDELFIEVKNKYGASPGQKVKLSLKENRFSTAAVIMFFFPLLVMLFGYFAGNWFIELLGFSAGERVGAVSSILFLLLYFIFIRFLDRRNAFTNRFRPEMIELLD